MPFDGFLSNDQINNIAPSVFALAPSPKVSERYAYLPTYPVIEQLRARGLGVTSVKQGRTRDRHGRMYVMHEVRMAMVGDVYSRQTRELGNLTPQIILLNSHNRTTSMTMFGGLLRGLCHNGLFFGSADAGGFEAMHYRMDMERVTDAAYAIVERFERLIEGANAWSKIRLTQEQARRFGQKAIEIRGTSMNVDPMALVVPNRPQDIRDDLWTTFNTVQERLTHGTVQAQRANNSWRKLPAIKSLKVDVDMNRKLWAAASELAAEVMPVSVVLA